MRTLQEIFLVGEGREGHIGRHAIGQGDEDDAMAHRELSCVVGSGGEAVEQKIGDLPFPTEASEDRDVDVVGRPWLTPAGYSQSSDRARLEIVGSEKIQEEASAGEKG